MQITMFKFHREVDKFAWPFKAKKFDSVRDGAAADGAAAAAASAPVDAAGTSPAAAPGPAPQPGSVVAGEKIRWMKLQRENKRKLNEAMGTALEKVYASPPFLRVMFFHRANLSRAVAHPFHCASRAGVCDFSCV